MKKKMKLTSMPKSDKLSVIFIMAVILAVLVTQYAVNIRKDEDVARKRMTREMVIVELRLIFELDDVEYAVSVMRPTAAHMLHHPDSLQALTHRMVRFISNLQAAGIAFEPYYFPEHGKWYEPSSWRKGNMIFDEQSGGPHHDYFSMDWYREGLTADPEHGHWTHPYQDNTQDNKWVTTFSMPLFDENDSIIGVIATDVALDTLRRVLKKSEPYKGSVCRLTDLNGHVIAGSDSILPDPEKCFTDSMRVGNYDLMVHLSCPKKAIYGSTILMELLTLALMSVCIALLIWIGRRSIHSISELHEARESQQKLEHEMLMAHNIQMGILRTDFPSGVAAHLLPMQEVGGDLYDFCERDGALWFIVGDVSGKGVPAAMMMGATVTLFRNAVRQCESPADIVSEINTTLSDHNPNLMFVTTFVGRLDLQHGLLTYCCAGHNPPVLNGEVMNIAPDIPIGFRSDYRYRQHNCLFHKGSRLVLYTDGITEARNQEHEQMGLDRLRDIIRSQDNGTAEKTVMCVIEAVCDFCGDYTQTDDMAVMCIVNDVTEQHPSLTLSNALSELTRAKTLLRAYCDAVGLTSKQTREMCLALEEALVNVVNYAYPEGTSGLITLDITASSGADGRRIALTLSDRGAPFDPTAQPEVNVGDAVNARQAGGLGILFYKTLMDDVSYRRSDDGCNILSMTKTFAN